MKGLPKKPPVALIEKQALALFGDSPEKERFIEALVEGTIREPALIVLQDRPEIKAFPKERPLPWQPPFVVRVVESFKASKHPLYAKGAFYSLDFSSVFAASVMLAIDETPRRVLDLCASPGGKAVFAWRAFQPELLVANEPIRNRVKFLRGNLERCGIERSVITALDPSVFGRKAADAFDLVIVDAPCSGQSLYAKGETAEGAFDPKMIDINVSRQRRILGNAARCVRPGGHLLYMTCTFSRKENEKVVEWLRGEYPEFQPVEVADLREFQSAYSEDPAYRLFPQNGLGAGAYACLLRRDGEMKEELPSLDEMPVVWRYDAEEARKARAAAKPAPAPPSKEPKTPAAQKRKPMRTSRPLKGRRGR